MPDLPHQTILNREAASAEMENHFAPQLDLLTQLANYASNLIPRAYIHSEQKLPDLIGCNVLLKQVAVMLDAIEILARQLGTHRCIGSCSSRVGGLVVSR